MSVFAPVFFASKLLPLAVRQHLNRRDLIVRTILWCCFPGFFLILFSFRSTFWLLRQLYHIATASIVPSTDPPLTNSMEADTSSTNKEETMDETAANIRDTEESTEQTSTSQAEHQASEELEEQEEEEEELPPEPDSMEYWQERCSICFDKNLEFCLQPCRDQFCFECFQRYIAEVVNNSWGLSITEVKCPVCMNTYATEETVNRYDEYNKPYRPFARHCDECKEEVCVINPPDLNLDKEDRIKILNKTKEQLTMYLSTQNDEKTMDTLSEDTLKRFSDDITKYTEDDYIDIQDIYTYVSDVISRSFMDAAASDQFTLRHLPASPRSTCSGKRRVDEVNPEDTSDTISAPVTPRKRRRLTTRILSSRDTTVSNIITSLCQLETRPIAWRELQFKVVAKFPRTRCQSCYRDICMQCGEQTHHRGLSCQQYLRQTLQRGTRSLDAIKDDLQWKLDNSKPCPNCCVLIDHCLYCGYRFCWICLDAWSEKCGFYRCAKAPDEEAIEQVDDRDKHKDVTKKLNEVSTPEMGVPDVFSIQARITHNTP
ncbi:hypothetical protein BDF22DRAFT_693482 [Syncephalis plumigaleata]|nr:hypothetical protein BDF22DRAFT_693482 [Syncephalis plumigaleata]